MKPYPVASVSVILAVLFCFISAVRSAEEKPASLSATAKAQVPEWSPEDAGFFLHGSMSTEVVPEAVLKAFFRIYPELFPKADLSHLGLIPDPAFGWPVGFSRSKVPHLGGLSAVGINCAACHVGDIVSSSGGELVRVLGMTSLFDAEAFFGSVIVSTFKTADPANMKKFLAAYLAVSDPIEGERMQGYFDGRWKEQEEKIIVAIVADPSGSKDLKPGALHDLKEWEVRFGHVDLADADLAKVAHSMLKLFHNMRAALHVPDQPPDKAPPASGPGRNDAFGLLSAVLFGTPQPWAPAKYGLVWNLDKRTWVHADGNTNSPLGRNLLASLGLGAPLDGKHGRLEFALVKRQTDLSERIRPPRYPFAIDDAAAKRGAAHYQTHCASCHDGPESDKRLYSPAEVGTDPLRATLFTPPQARNFNTFLAELETPGYKPAKEPAIRSTQKYWAASMAGVWARSPYLHNASVRTMLELLTPPAARAKSFHRGTRAYDTKHMGYADDGAYLLDTSVPGSTSTGHDYGTGLTGDQKQDLIEYLKTL